MNLLSNTMKHVVVSFALFGMLATNSPALTPAELGAQHHVKIAAQRGYLPGVPVLVRVEVRNNAGPERELWNADAMMSVDDPNVTLSTNRIHLRNGISSELIAFRGGSNFNLIATVGSISGSHSLVTLSDEPMTTAGGSLAGANTWSGVVRVTNDVTVPAGASLTILSNTLVLIDGVASGTTANDLLISGRLESLGTDEYPVTITCNSTNPTMRWGQIRHDASQPSVYRYTSINRAGRGTSEGHTATCPVIRPTGSRLLFDNCNITDLDGQTRGAADFGQPGKIGEAAGSDLTLIDCLLQRARMGPEIDGTALGCTNTWILDMAGPDDADGIYLHGQGAGQIVALKGCVVAHGDDDGIDTLGSTITVEDCIIREWNNQLEDAKGISVLNGEVDVRRCLIVDSTVGIAAKSGGSTPSTTPVLVTVSQSTLFGNTTNIYANRKSSAVGPHVKFNVTNCVMWNGKPAYSDFEPGSSDSTNFTIRYCNLSEPYAGTGNLNLDPLFVNAGAYDFHLRPLSPCIDTGDPAYPLDGDGSKADLGYLPFVPPAPLLGNAARVAGGIEFTLDAYPGRNYAIEFSTNVASGWSMLRSQWQTNNTSTVQDAVTDEHRFYRARWGL